MLLNSKHKKYMEMALREAKKGLIKNEVPVGVVITNEIKIISKSYNQVEAKQNACMHAEIIAINKACKRLETKFLDKCTIYATLEPCNLCMQAIYISRIKKLFFAAPITSYTKNLNDNFSREIEIYNDILKKESQHLLQIFFKNIRQKL